MVGVENQHANPPVRCPGTIGRPGSGTGAENLGLLCCRHGDLMTCRGEQNASASATVPASGVLPLFFQPYSECAAALRQSLLGKDGVSPAWIERPGSHRPN